MPAKQLVRSIGRLYQVAPHRDIVVKTDFPAIAVGTVRVFHDIGHRRNALEFIRNE
jgi:hypothetical protein